MSKVKKVKVEYNNWIVFLFVIGIIAADGWEWIGVLALIVVYDIYIKKLQRENEKR